MKNVVKNQTYWEEEYLCFIYKLANINRFFGKGFVGIDEIAPKETSSAMCSSYFMDLVQVPNIRIENWQFHKELYKKNELDEYEKMKNMVQNNFGNLESLWNNNFKWQDFENYPMGQASMWDYVVFSAEQPSSFNTEINNYLKDYLDDYINEKLSIVDKNIVLFSKQRKGFNNYIDRREDEYGNEFLLYDNDVEFIVDNKVLFFHNIIAYEMLGLLTIEELNITTMEDSLNNKERCEVKARITDKYHKDRQKEIKGLTKQNKNNNLVIKFSNKDSILQIGEHKIKIARSKNTTAHYLLNLLVNQYKDISDEYFYSEIANDLNDEEYKYRVKGWNRYYKACLQINDITSKKTNGLVNDFINFNTKSCWFSNKYLSK